MTATATVTAYVRQLALRSITMRGLFLMTCGLSLVTWGCEAARDEDSLSEAERPSVSRTARDGPVLLTLSVTPAGIDVSEHAQVRVEVSAKQGVTVEVDDYRNALTGFEYRVVSSFEEVAKPSADGRLRWTYRYELEFFLPGEIELPEVQPGSSIMPGKVNPVIPESVCQVAAQVIGNDAAIVIAGQSGNFEINVMMPVAAFNLLQSIDLLAAASSNLAIQCISGLKATQKGPEMVERGLAIVTSLVPHIG